MMRAALALCALALPLAWPAHAKVDYPPDERPMYGGADPADAKPGEAVLAACKKAAKKADSDVSAACASLGFKAFHEGDFAHAVPFFNAAWALQPGNASAYHGFALVLTERDENDIEAEAMFRKAIDLPAAPAGVYLDYARFLILYERYEDAIPVLEAGLAKAARSKPDFQFGLVTAYEQLHEYPKACELARQVVGDLKDFKRDAMREFIGGEHCRTS